MGSVLLLPLLEVVGGGPAAVEDALLGVFVEALALEDGTAVAAVNEALFAALLGDRSHAGEALELVSVLETVLVGAQGRQEAESQDRARAGEAVEEGGIGMGCEGLMDLDLGVVGGDGLADQVQLATDQLDAEGEGVDDGGLVGQGNGFIDEGQAFCQEGSAAGAVGVVEGFEGGGAGFLDRLEAGAIGGGRRWPEGARVRRRRVGGPGESIV